MNKWWVGRWNVDGWRAVGGWCMDREQIEGPWMEDGRVGDLNPAISVCIISTTGLF